MVVILASASPRREELLKKSIQHFEIIPADIDETIQEKEKPLFYVERMAKEKASAIDSKKSDIVIGCDTTVVVDELIMAKPTDAKEASGMLKRLSGRSHHVLTSVYIKHQSDVFKKTEVVEVTFYELEKTDIDNYIKTGEYQDKAGAYGIQGRGALFVKSIVGDYYSIVGFPIGYVHQVLKKCLRKEEKNDKK